MSKDLKYIVAYLAPIIAYINVIKGGSWSFATVLFLFGLIPLLDLLLSGTKKNLSEEEELSQSAKKFFDLLLYINVPILFGLLYLYFNQMAYGDLMFYEKYGMTIGTGMMVGALGINVAHELGHRSGAFDLFLAKSLLMTAFYMHFNIEHNRGHHKFVATPEDPSSARFNESVYAFWLRSISGVYIKAWQLEHRRLDQLGILRLSWQNEMIRFQIIQLGYFLLVAYFWSWSIAGLALILGLIGVLLLETVNYIEHYGLQRKKKESGRYEAVGPHHSWNSNHEMGRIFLYELTRHSDHHFKATRKYQVLRHFDESPQLPTGYPGSMLTALIPPIWFKMMNKRVEDFNALEMSY